MNKSILAADKFRHSGVRRSARLLGWVAGILLLPGCGVFNSSFLSLLDPAGTGIGGTIDLPTGFVVVTFANNAIIDDQLVSFLEGTGLVLTDAEKIALRPRIRLPVRITFADNSILDVEFISGSTEFVEPRFLAESAPDLNQTDLDTVVVACEVRSVELRPGSPIEVFIPVELEQLAFVTVSGAGGQSFVALQTQALVSPRFRALQVDIPSPGGLVELRQNIGIEDLPAPIRNPLCGSVIGIILDGTLSVPFDPRRSGPSLDVGDPIQVGRIGGRFEFRVTIG